MVPGYLSWFCDLITFGETPEGSRKKKRSTYYNTFDKRVGEGQSNHCTARSTGPKRKKSQVRVAKYGMRLKHEEERLAQLKEELHSRIQLGSTDKKSSRVLRFLD